MKNHSSTLQEQIFPALLFGRARESNSKLPKLSPLTYNKEIRSQREKGASQKRKESPARKGDTDLRPGGTVLLSQADGQPQEAVRVEGRTVGVPRTKRYLFREDSLEVSLESLFLGKLGFWRKKVHYLQKR